MAPTIAFFLVFYYWCYLYGKAKEAETNKSFVNLIKAFDAMNNAIAEMTEANNELIYQTERLTVINKALGALGATGASHAK